MSVYFFSFFLVSFFAAFGNALNIYGVWHCGTGDCTWQTAPSASQLSWMMDRGDGKPVFNVFSLSFGDPQAVLSSGVGAVPSGITKAFVQSLQAKGIKVFLSLGGINLISSWISALSNPQQLAANCWAIAKQFGVGIEIDYEDVQSLSQLDAFVKAYRALNPASGSAGVYGDSALFTIDVDSGNSWLIALDTLAAGWVNNGYLNWLNRMVGSTSFSSSSEAIASWTQGIGGGNGVPAVSGSKATVALYGGNGVSVPDVECASYQGSIASGTSSWLSSNGVLGLMYWGPGRGPVCPGLQQASLALLSWGSSGGYVPPPPSSVTAVNCVGQWGSCGTCSKTCGGGTQTCTYSILIPASNGGAQCAYASGASQGQACGTASCSGSTGGGSSGGVFSCPALFGYFPDPASCSKFFICANGNSFSQSCSAGLYWNSLISTCDYAANVQCSSARVGELTDNKTSTGFGGLVMAVVFLSCLTFFMLGFLAFMAVFYYKNMRKSRLIDEVAE